MQFIETQTTLPEQGKKQWAKPQLELISRSNVHGGLSTNNHEGDTGTPEGGGTHSGRSYVS